MNLRKVILWCVSLVALIGSEALAQEEFKVLVFSKTAEFRHGSIPDGVAAIQQLGTTNHFTVDATEDGAQFNDASLAQYAAVIFLNTTGDVLETNQQSAFERYIQAGGGYVGVHSATDTERSWPWYGQLIGAWQFNHPPGTASATVKITDHAHPSTKDLPDRWVRTDEWYNFQSNPAGNVHVLAWLDESSASNYFASASGAMGFDHPIAWCHEFDGGRSWYTALGHTSATFSEPMFRQHLLGGILWAAGAVPGDAGATVWDNFEKTVLDNNALVEPIALDVAPDGRVFYIERVGRLNIFLPASSTRVQIPISVNSATSDGLIGIALDPGFVTNQWLYLTYGPSGTEDLRLSRFTMNSNALDFASEKILLTMPIESSIANHIAGDLEFGPDGCLYMSTGDNSRFSGAPNNGYGPIDERPGESQGDAQRTAANTMDLRGKILRIKPEPDGTYSIPAGNLFPVGTPLTRPEIYAMGCRNPYRLTVDPVTGWVYWGEVGPDASGDSATRGPRGYDEWNQARGPGFFGWPYGLANNKPYMDFDFATSATNGYFNLTNPANTSPNNTGITNLPAAQPAWIWYPYGTSPDFPELGVSNDRCAMMGSFYHYNSNLLSAYKLPAYYDNTLFVIEFSRNWMREIKLDTNGNVLKINQFLPNFTLNSPIEMKTGPDGALYLIEYGTGWRAQNTGGQLSRITYTAGNHAPVAKASGSPTDGLVPLTVQFSSAGTSDPEAQPVTLAWDFDLDGTIDSTNANPSFTYTNAGNYIARLMVTDPLSAQGISDVFISAGNTRPTVTIQSPPDGSFFNWGDFVRFSIGVNDAEDGSTGGGSIDCGDVLFETALGHDEHAHAEDSIVGCQGLFQTALDHTGTENIFYLVAAQYLDNGAPGVDPLIGAAAARLNPKRLEVEHYDFGAGINTQDTGDTNGVRDVVSIDHGDYIAFTPINLTNISAVQFRVAAATGGNIELRLDGTNGPLVGTAVIPATGGVYSTVALPIADPGGTHVLYLVFSRNPGDTDLFRLNWTEFQGAGVGIPLTPFTGTPVNLPGTIQAENFDIGGAEISFHDLTSGNSGGQFRLDTDMDIETCSDVGGGYNLTALRSNEWARYTVNVTVAGTYTLQARVASTGPGGTFRLESNGVDKTGPISVPATGGPQIWQNVSVTNVSLISGPHVFRLLMLSDGPGGNVGNINSISLALVAPNAAPTVALVSPAPGSSFAAPVVLPLAATAGDADGSVTAVEFFANGTKLGSAAAPPYTLLWTNSTAGNFALTARALDDFGHATTSSVVTVTVTNVVWQNQDVGAVAAAGSFSSDANGVFTVNGSGNDIWNTADEFHFVYRPFTGNGEIVARVLAVGTTDPFAKGGTMFRESLNGNSRNCFMGMTRDNGPIFQWRTNTGGSSVSYRPVVLPTPHWVRLMRVGNTFTGYRSTDGVNWTFHQSISNFISSSAFVGLAVSSHLDGTISTSTFDNVELRTPPVIVTPPANQATTAGSAAQFNVVATGAQPLSYQWRRNGSPVVGGTNFTFYLAAASTDAAGSYTVVVSNHLGSVTSAVAQLTVTLPPPLLSSPVGGYWSNGVFRLALQGVPGESVVVETSTNLVHWSGIATNVLDSGGLYHFIDPAASSRPRLFYRGRYLP
ncbi:MAG TPA: ThuA domain-containing protein [Verrucomicrobiae bacterium]|nr:ThuA domain-containing protein [Verrucomicrobiae bacterium]